MMQGRASNTDSIYFLLTSEMLYSLNLRCSHRLPSTPYFLDILRLFFTYISISSTIFETSLLIALSQYLSSFQEPFSYMEIS